MNTQGWMRGLMAKNRSEEKFIEHVVECLGREFEAKASLSKQGDSYVVEFDSYRIVISNARVEELQSQGAYCLDKYLLDKLIEEGYSFDKHRSQYIRYCYGIFYRTESGTVY
jgi:hypothetical protein